MASSTQRVTRLVSPLLTNPIEVAAIDNVVTKDVRNVANGPATVNIAFVNNTRTSGSKNWLKLYDVADNAFVAGSSKPIMVFPIKAGVAATSAVLASGVMAVQTTGIKFRNGCSYLSSQENGDTMTAGPAKDMDAYFSFA